MNTDSVDSRVPTGPGKSLNFGGPFSRPGKSWKSLGMSLKKSGHSGTCAHVPGFLPQNSWVLTGELGRLL